MCTVYGSFKAEQERQQRLKEFDARLSLILIRGTLVQCLS